MTTGPRRALRAAITALVIPLAGCSSSYPTHSVATVLNVVTTTTQVSDLTRVVGGERIRVTQILKANIDPHDYEPTPADTKAIGDAKVIVINGVGLETWLQPLIDASGTKVRPTDTSAGVPLRTSGSTPGPDPHIWQDVRNAKTMVASIVSALSAAMPSAATTFHSNGDSYQADLDTLDGELGNMYRTLTNNKIVTNHDAFGYLIDEYGLTFVGAVIPSFDSQSEASGKALTALVAAVKAEGVKAIFAESSLPAKAADALAHDAGVKVVEGEDSLYGDTLGPVGSDGDTYLKMMRHNARVIVENLR